MTEKLTAWEILEKLILEVSCCLSRTEEKAEIAKALAQLELLKLTREEIDRAITLADRNDFISDAILKAQQAKWEGRK